MKLFIWDGDGVLTDWSNGLIVVVAKDIENALKAIKEKCNADGCFPSLPTEVIELNEDTPARAWLCWGGS